MRQEHALQDLSKKLTRLRGGKFVKVDHGEEVKQDEEKEVIPYGLKGEGYKLAPLTSYMTFYRFFPALTIAQIPFCIRSQITNMVHSMLQRNTALRSMS
eukprot:6597708-Pyramimonas_sp.AAC.1